MSSQRARLYHAGAVPPALDPRRREPRSRSDNCVAIAAILNHEGWRPPKRRDTFNGPDGAACLDRHWTDRGRAPSAEAVPQRCPDEWTINELAAEIGTPLATIYNWVQKGRLSSRSVEVRGTFNTLVTADAATIVRLKAARATPLPFRRGLLSSVNSTLPTLDS